MVLRQKPILLCAIVFALALQGCGRTTMPFAVPNDNDPGRTLAAIQQISGSLPAEDYRLGPGDIVEIKVYGVKDLETTVRIPEAGTFDFPLVGTVKAAGLSAPEVEKAIAKALTERYIQDAHVMVFVKEYNSYRVTIVGAVTKPGTVVLRKGTCTVVDALAEAGGLTEKAGNDVYVNRRDASGKCAVTVVDLKLLLEQGKLDQNLPLAPGDSVYVPENGYVFVTGYVKQPGAYPLRKDMTALQAISTAGDFLSTASGHVRLIRRNPPTKPHIQEIDLAAVSGGKKPDVMLEKSDVIEAEPSLWKVPVYGTFDFIKSIFGIGATLR